MSSHELAADSLTQRLRLLLASWPETARRHSGEALARFTRDPGGCSPRRWSNHPGWLVIPEWLFHRHVTTEPGRNTHRKFLEDIVFAQYCLFLFVRLQDDLLDDLEKNVNSTFISQLLYLESERLFQERLADEPDFKKIRLALIRKTILTALQAQSTQTSPETTPEELLKLNADLASVLHVGTAAICMRFGDRSEWGRLERILTELALAGQILDDLADLEEDLRAGRFSYVAKILVGLSRTTVASAAEAVPVVAEQLIRGPGLQRIEDEIGRHLAGPARWPLRWISNRW